MEHLHCTTETRKKGAHLTLEERVIIQTRLKDGWRPNKIAREIGCAPNTIRNEIKRGSKPIYNGNVIRYYAKLGQETYTKNREACGRHYDYLDKGEFLDDVRTKFYQEHWSLDACFGYALKKGLFERDQMVCTKTLYNYCDLGLLGIANIDLPEKLKRAPKKKRNREHKKILGRSIEERPETINNRSEFGHWEADLVIGSKRDDDDAILTLIERMTRQFLMIRVPGRSPSGIMEAISKLRSEYSEHWDEVFKTITTDNGAEFSSLSDLETFSQTLVYFAHPYSSYEKGSIERHNRLIRRFIKKGTRIDSYSEEKLLEIYLWCNALPRKALNYKTPDELFDLQLDAIYAIAG